MSRLLVIFFAIVCCATSVFGSDAGDAAHRLADDPRVNDAIAAWDAWIEYQLAIQRIPAASVGIVHDQELLFARGIGLANPDTGEPATADTIYSNWMTKVQ